MLSSATVSDFLSHKTGSMELFALECCKICKKKSLFIQTSCNVTMSISIWKPNETDVRAYPGPSNSWLRSSAELKVNLNGLNKSRIKVVKSESGSRVRFDQTDLTDKVSLI